MINREIQPLIEAMEYIDIDEKNWTSIENLNYPPVQPPQGSKADFGEIFEKIEKYSQIAFSIIYPKIITDSVHYIDKLDEFIELVYSYQDKQYNKLVNPSHEKKIYIDENIYAKYLARLYTCESDFYRDINKNLSNGYKD